MADDKDYSKREIDVLIHDMKEQLDRIENQVVKTNGRVTRLEFWKASLIGGWGVITLFVIPLLVWVFFHEIDGIRADISKVNAEILIHSK